MRSVYEIGPDFELSPKVLEFEKICWDWNRKVFNGKNRAQTRTKEPPLQKKQKK